ncbi:LAMI_0G13872g1_1 [Lachancea mirantina]|uniref:LAMI_0G13872g1_1 n=1 Tax=Lachancea mirantina TaxID=1230905 RepID=A0A1G4KBX9_9SACH|nr:LAMI_0G13872g1_1 [Lachancea mirantina]
MQEDEKSIWNPAFMGNVQQNQNAAPYLFKNPWNENGGATNRNSGVFSQPLPTTYEEPDRPRDRDDFQFRRRNSSLIVPPTRAAGPAPPDSLLYNGSQLFPMQDAHDVSMDLHRRQSVAVTLPHTFNTQHGTAAEPPFQQTASTFHRKLSTFPGAVLPAAPPPLKQLRRQEEILQPFAIPQMHRVAGKQDLHPTVNATPKYRRASLNSKTVSPLIALTDSLITTYTLCSSEFSYQTSKNPKRVLTKPSEGKHNNGYDNANSDYILYVNDVLGIEQNRKYLVLDILGQGTFGQVVKCQNLITKEIVAVKVVKSKSEYLNQSITEAKILELLNNKIDPMNQHHFLRLHETFVHRNHLCLVFELLSNNLYELLKQNQFHGLSISLIRTFSRQLLDSLGVLKDNKIIHCDLKPENILLVSLDRPELKVIDFGSACEETRTVYTYIQSRFYRAPEVILGIPYSAGIDMWSFGCIIVELFLGIPIFPGSSEFNQITRIVDTLGLPPTWMLDMGKNSSNFLNKTSDADKTWRLKTVAEYNAEYKTKEQPGKQYFKWRTLEDIVQNYRLSKKLAGSPALVEREMQERKCLTNFLEGILNLNPLERWTPQQAALHPFITQQPFCGTWYPPGSTPARAAKRDRPKEAGTSGTANEFTKLRIDD